MKHQFLFITFIFLIIFSAIHTVFGFSNWPVNCLFPNGITSDFGPRIYQDSYMHDGLDFVASHGQEVRAVEGGIVEYKNWQNPSYHKEGWGYNIRIKGETGTQVYGHLIDDTMPGDIYEPQVKYKDNVVPGQIIGYADNTGQSSGNHLHLTTATDSSLNTRVNPLQFFSYSDTSPSISNYSIKALTGGSVQQEGDVYKIKGKVEISATVETREKDLNQVSFTTNATPNPFPQKFVFPTSNRKVYKYIDGRIEWIYDNMTMTSSSPTTSGSSDQFYYVWDTDNCEPGVYNVRVQAYDIKNNQSSPVEFKVSIGSTDIDVTLDKAGPPKGPVVVTYKVSGQSIKKINYLENGNPKSIPVSELDPETGDIPTISGGETYSQEGKYQIVLEAFNKADKRFFKELEFYIDKNPPKLTYNYVLPSSVSENSIVPIFAGGVVFDEKSGINFSKTASINLNGISYPVKLIGIGQYSTFFGLLQAPQKAGSYPVTISGVTDKAGNKMPDALLGTVIVNKGPDPKDDPNGDNPTNPDESLDLFNSTIKGNQAPIFGQVKVGVLNSGYAREMVDLLATFGEAADFIEPENFSPGLADKYRLILIPSSGLTGLKTKPDFRDKFTEYVSTGGNLVVMTQPTGDCYNLLPDKVEALGYYQDNACRQASAGIVKYNPAMAGQYTNTLDGTVDGVITSWPKNSEIWLTRLKNNFPALLAYPIGQGKVIVSSFYSDYAHGHSQLFRSEKVLIRDLLSWGRDFANDLPVVQESTVKPVSVLVNFVQVSGTPSYHKASKVRLVLRTPNREKVAMQDYDIELTPGGSVSVVYDFDDTNDKLSHSTSGLGIWWLNYELLDTDGQVIQSELEGQRVVLSKQLAGYNTANIGITIETNCTTALEEDIIPFKIMARNNGENGRSLSFKVYEVLYSLVSKVQNEREIYSGNINVNAQATAEASIDLSPFKAYILTSRYSWDKNWWRFVFYDETGKMIASDFRGVYVYRPAAKVNYQLKNLTDRGQVLFRPGDQVGLELQIENMAPIGYQVDWELKVKAKNQNQRVILEKSGSEMLNPVLLPYQAFTVPEDCNPDTYELEIVVKHNGVVIPLVNGDLSISNSGTYLEIRDYSLSKNGITMTLYNPYKDYTDYSIFSRVFDQSNKLLKEDYQTGGINGQSEKTILVPYDKFAPCYNYRLEGLALTFPTTHAQTFRHSFNAQQGLLKIKVNSARQDVDNRTLNYNLEIENPGPDASDVQLKIFNEANFVHKTSLPVILSGQKIQFPVELSMTSGLVQGFYPIKFALYYDNDTEVLIYQHYPELGSNILLANNGVDIEVKNSSLLDADYKLNYQIVNQVTGLLATEGECAGFVKGGATTKTNIPVVNINPFNGHLLTGKIIYPSSNREISFEQRVEPFKLRLEVSQSEQNLNNKVGFNIKITNLGGEIGNLPFNFKIPVLNVSQDFNLPVIGNMQTVEFPVEISLATGISPGTFPAYLTFLNSNGMETLKSKTFMTILQPRCNITGPEQKDYHPGDIFAITIANNGTQVFNASYKMTLVDSGGQVISVQTGLVDLNPGQLSNIQDTLKPEINSGKYSVKWDVTTGPVKINITGKSEITVIGAEATLTVNTDRIIYRTTENILSQALIQNGNYPVNGQLDLAITKLITGTSNGERIDGWPTFQGDFSRTGLGKLSGSIAEPFFLWRSDQMSLGSVLFPLIGDVDGDGLNEVIHSNEGELYITDGTNGWTKKIVTLYSFYPNFTTLTSALLYDINGDEAKEIIICANGVFLMALNGQGEIVWSQEFSEIVLDNPYMTITDLFQNGIKQLLLNNRILDVSNGTVIKTNTRLGIVADLNKDEKLEIVTPDAILDDQFTILFARDVANSEFVLPIVIDLNKDGIKEIIICNKEGLFVYNHQYILQWSYNTTGITKPVIGDVDNDGYYEVFLAKINLAIQPNFDLTCFSYSGAIKWQKTEPVSPLVALLAGQSDAGFGSELSLLTLNDINSDGQLDVILNNILYRLSAFNGLNGNKLWDLEFPAFPQMALGDVDGDCESEIVTGSLFNFGYVCIDNSVRKQSPQIITVPKIETYMQFTTLTWPKALVRSNGDLWAVANQGIIYYKPQTGQNGLIPIQASNMKHIAVKEQSNLIEVWDTNRKLLLGVIDLSSDIYSIRNIVASDCGIYNPLQSKDGFYYYFLSVNTQDDYGDQVTYKDLYRKNLTGGETIWIGRFDSDISIEILKVIDSQKILAYYNDTLVTVALPSMIISNLIAIPEGQVGCPVWTDSDHMYFTSNQKIYRYQSSTNQLSVVFDIIQAAELLDDNTLLTTPYTFIVKDLNTLYLICDRYLLELNLISGNIAIVATPKEYGYLAQLHKEGNTYLLAFKQFEGSIFSFNNETGTTIEYAAPSTIKEIIKNNHLWNVQQLIKAPNNQIYLLVSGLKEVNSNNFRRFYELFRIDPLTNEWSQTLFGNSCTTNNIIPQTIAFGPTSDKLYVYTYYDSTPNSCQLMEYSLNSNTITILDQGISGIDPTITYDGDQRLYYSFGSNRSYDINSGQTTDIVATPTTLLPIGAKNNSVYHLNPTQINLAGLLLGIINGEIPDKLIVYFNIEQYSIMDKKNEINSSFVIEKQLVDLESDLLNLTELIYNNNFDRTAMKVALIDNPYIMEFDLNKIKVPIANNNIYETVEDSSGGRTTIAQTSIPITLTTNESRNMEYCFDPVIQPGSYLLEGRLKNNYNQVISRDEKAFIVSTNGIGLCAATDKKAYRPNELLSINGMLINTANQNINDLKLQLFLRGNGQNVLVEEETLSLNANETKPVNFSTLLSTIEGDYTIEAKLLQNSTMLASWEEQIKVVNPSLQISLNIPTQVGSRPFTAEIKLENTSPYPLNLQFKSSLLQFNQLLTLAAGETFYITKELHISNSVNLILEINGDINKVLEHKINFVEQASLTVDLDAVVADTLNSVPFELRNTGLIAAEFPVSFYLYRENQLITDNTYQFYLEPGQIFNGNLPVTLTSGSYKLEYGIASQIQSVSFNCLPEQLAELIVSPNLINSDQMKLDLIARNRGCLPVAGNIIISADFFQLTTPVNLNSGTELSKGILINGLPLEAGTYPIKVEITSQGQTLATQLVDFTRESTVAATADYVFTAVPQDLVVGTGQEVIVNLKVKNIGTVKGEGLVELISTPFFAESVMVNLGPGEEKEVTFKMTVPEELESGAYNFLAVINGKETSFKYQVNGYKVFVTAKLDKPYYLNGENASLTLNIQNIGGQSGVPLLVRVKHGEFDEIREIILGQDSVLNYTLPAEAFDEKIFYGIYLASTERSLFLNVHNIYQAYPEFSVKTDKQVYQPGEVVQVSVLLNQPGWLAITGPGEFHCFEEVNGFVNYAIPLPDSLPTGTYSIWMACAGKTLEYKIDVLGHDLRFVSGNLNQTSYQKGDQFKMETTITTGTAFNVATILELVKPDGNIIKLEEREVSLMVGENHLDFIGIIDSEQIGTHWLRVTVREDDNKVSAQNFAFMVGQEELLSIVTDQESYFNGTETVTTTVYLCGQGHGTINVALDENLSFTNQVSLNGNTKVTFTIPGTQIKPGIHKISVSYNSDNGSSSSTVYTCFNYGTGLPDLEVTNVEISKERSNDCKLPITVTIKKSHVLPVEQIPVEIRINNQVIANYVIDKLIKDGDTHRQVIFWDTKNFYGQGEVEVLVNVDNQINEYNFKNNIQKTTIVIPQKPQISEIRQLSKDSNFPISGETSPGVLVLLYGLQGIIDFTYADNGGGFTLNSFNLPQGQNSLRLIAWNQEGWCSCFTDYYQVMVDSVLPEINITNIEDGQYFSLDLLPEINVIEANSVKAIYTLNGQSWTPGTLITQEGTYQLVIKISDIAGNEAELQRSFIIDKTPPQVEINGILDGAFYNTPLTPVIKATDKNLSNTEISLNGEVYQGNQISIDGKYSLNVLALDKANNNTDKTVNFIIDRVKPVIEIAGVVDGGLYNQAVTPKISIIEPYLETSKIILDGQKFENGTSINNIGDHELSVTAIDKAGNSVNHIVRFKIDYLPPVTTISMAGSKWSNGDYKDTVIVSLTAVDNEGGSGVATIYYRLGANSSEVVYQGPFTISNGGITELYYYSVDKTNNRETPRKQDIKIGKIWTPKYTLLCQELKVLGNVSADRIFSNGCVATAGKCSFNYLGTTLKNIIKLGKVQITTLETRAPYQTLPQPDWAALEKETTLLKDDCQIGEMELSNVRAEHNILLHGKVKLSGLLVVKGDLHISGNLELNNVGIFCTGRVTIAGNAKVSGLIYAGSDLAMVGTPILNCTVIVNGKAGILGHVGSCPPAAADYLVWLRKNE